MCGFDSCYPCIIFFKAPQKNINSLKPKYFFLQKTYRSLRTLKQSFFPKTPFSLRKLKNTTLHRTSFFSKWDNFSFFWKSSSYYNFFLKKSVFWFSLYLLYSRFFRLTIDSVLSFSPHQTTKLVNPFGNFLKFSPSENYFFPQDFLEKTKHVFNFRRFSVVKLFNGFSLISDFFYLTKLNLFSKPAFAVKMTREAFKLPTIIRSFSRSFNELKTVFALNFSSKQLSFRKYEKLVSYLYSPMVHFLINPLGSEQALNKKTTPFLFLLSKSQIEIVNALNYFFKKPVTGLVDEPFFLRRGLVRLLRGFRSRLWFFSKTKYGFFFKNSKFFLKNYYLIFTRFTKTRKLNKKLQRRSTRAILTSNFFKKKTRVKDRNFLDKSFFLKNSFKKPKNIVNVFVGKNSLPLSEKVFSIDNFFFFNKNLLLMFSSKIRGFYLFLKNPFLFKLFFLNQNLGSNKPLTGLSFFLDKFRLTTLPSSNLYPHTVFRHVFTQKILNSSANIKFRPPIVNWSYHNLSRFFEYLTGRKVLIQFYPFLAQEVSPSFVMRYRLWLPRMAYYERKLGHRFFLEEAVHILHLSFFLKDCSLFTSWLKSMILRISFWRTRSIFRFLRYVLSTYFIHIFEDLGIKGLKIKLKGKISVAGNSRKRTILYRIGKTSHSTIDLKVLHEKKTINTFTGVMGFQVWLFF